MRRSPELLGAGDHRNTMCGTISYAACAVISELDPGPVPRPARRKGPGPEPAMGARHGLAAAL